MRMRDTQLRAFSDASRRRFENDLILYVKERFPLQYDALGPARLCERTTRAIERAQGYRLSSEADICRYAGLMFELGPDFDRDGRYPWAQRILENDELLARAKIEWLCCLAERQSHTSR